MLTSAKTNYGVDQLFKSILNHLWEIKVVNKSNKINDGDLYKVSNIYDDDNSKDIGRRSIAFQ